MSKKIFLLPLLLLSTNLIATESEDPLISEEKAQNIISYCGEDTQECPVSMIESIVNQGAEEEEE